MEKQLWKTYLDEVIEEVRRLLQNSQININWQNQNGYLDYFNTPFYVACQKGRIKIVKLLWTY